MVGEQAAQSANGTGMGKMTLNGTSRQRPESNCTVVTVVSCSQADSGPVRSLPLRFNCRPDLVDSGNGSMKQLIPLHDER